MNYSRKNPSTKYLELIEQYKLMHKRDYTEKINLSSDLEKCYDKVNLKN